MAASSSRTASRPAAHDNGLGCWTFWRLFSLMAAASRDGSRSEPELDAALVARDIEFYNLDVIISVGYRVKSHRGTQFRIWATQRLHEYIIKGFTLDDERLKRAGAGSYFEELLARIRDIRSSEKVFWRKMLDIYATRIDYDPNVEMTQRFFQAVQNKMHWAVHGQTAAEVIVRRSASFIEQKCPNE